MLLRYFYFYLDTPVKIRSLCLAADAVIAGTYMYAAHTGRWLVCQHNPEKGSRFTHWWQELTEAQVPDSYKGQALLLS